jgi:hypothetical protein
MIPKLSLFGLGAAVIFLALTLLAIQDTRWMDSVTFGLLGIAFLIRHMPKFLILRILDPYALILLAGGMALFFWDVTQQLGIRTSG